MNHISIMIRALKSYLIIFLSIISPTARLMANSTEAADTAYTDVPHELKDVVVTAQESRQATSTSLIDTTAMKHLQPSSFTDLLELLPGHITKDQ